MSSRRRWFWAVALVAALAGVIALLYVETNDYDVVLRQVRTEAVRIDFFGAFTVVVNPEVTPTVDVMTSIILFAVAALALFVPVLAGRARKPLGRRDRAFYVLLGLGAAYLAFDELVGVHEMIGYNLRDQLDVVGLHEPDDIVYASYAIPLVAFLVGFRDRLRLSRSGRLMLIGAGALFGLSVVLDSTNAGSTVLENVIELLAALLLLGGAGATLADHALAALGIRPPTGTAQPVAAAHAEPGQALPEGTGAAARRQPASEARATPAHEYLS